MYSFVDNPSDKAYNGDTDIHPKGKESKQMLNLKTAEEMHQYCVDNNLGTGTGKGWAIKHFDLLIQNLKPGEEIYCVFIGLHNYKSMTKHDGNFAYAMTNKRCIMAQHKIFGATVQSVNIENINDITMSKTGFASVGMGLGTVCIDTYKETFNVGVNISFAPNIYNCVHEAWDMARANINSSSNETASISNVKSPVEQIKELKELLDMGIITQEEFDTKKKSLLGL